MDPKVKQVFETVEEPYLDKAKRLVIEHNNLYKTTDNPDFLRLENVYVVWFVKTLQNWKALVSTTKPDGAYYELTYNGDRRETYVDHYVKVNNRCVADA